MNDSLPHILVVDDDNRLRDLLQRYLTENGFRVTAARDAKEARGRMQGFEFDAVILDVMMPGESGFEFIVDLRRGSNVPVLLLTAMGEPDDRIDGFERGADDYLVKPFEPRELLLRVNAILRRARAMTDDGIVSLGALAFDVARRELREGDDVVRLTSAEGNLLRVFATNAGRTLSREDLLSLSGIDGGDRTVDVQINRLRRKIEPDPRQPRYLQTVRGEGYVLVPD